MAICTNGASVTKEGHIITQHIGKHFNLNTKQNTNAVMAGHNSTKKKVACTDNVVWECVLMAALVMAVICNLVPAHQDSRDHAANMMSMNAPSIMEVVNMAAQIQLGLIIANVRLVIKLDQMEKDVKTLMNAW